MPLPLCMTGSYRSARSGANAGLRRCPFARQAGHEAVVIDDRALVEAVADRLGLVMAAHLEAQSAAVDLGELDFGRHLHADRRCGAVVYLDPGADRALIGREVGGEPGDA